MTLNRVSLAEIADDLEAEIDPALATSLPNQHRPRFNIAPSDRHLMLIAGPTARPHRITTGIWGFPKSTGTGLVINARSETAATRPMFAAAFAKSRCVIPADGFYEWRNGEDGQREPLWFRRADGRLLLLAGLFDREGHFVVLTTRPNATVATVHDRMPAILQPPQLAAWLAGSKPPHLVPADEGVLIASLASRRVNSITNDDPGCLTPDPPVQPRQLRLF